MTKFLLAALLGTFLFSSLANADGAMAPAKKFKTEETIEPIRLVPKQERGIASEDDGFVPVPSPAHKIPAAKKQKLKKKLRWYELRKEKG